MKSLKMQSLKSVLILIIMFWFFAGFLAYIAAPSITTYIKGPVDLEEVDFSSDIDGLYVSGTIYGIYDWYCEEEKNGKTVAREYLIDADDYYYIALRAESSSMTAADKLMNASQAYLNGEDDGTLLETAQYTVQGVIKDIPYDSLRYYKDYVGWYGMDEAERSMFLEYYIDVNSLGTYSITETILMVVLVIGCFLVGCIFLIGALTGRYQKSITNYIKKSSNPELARDKVENFLQNTPENGEFRYNREFICNNYGGNTAFGETAKLAWVYKETTNHKRGLITMYQTHSLVLGFADGTKQTAAVRSAESADMHILNLQELCPQIIIGYSDDLNKMFCKDINGFLNLRYHAPQSNE